MFSEFWVLELFKWFLDVFKLGGVNKFVDVVLFIGIWGLVDFIGVVLALLISVVKFLFFFMVFIFGDLFEFGYLIIKE